MTAPEVHLGRPARWVQEPVGVALPRQRAEDDLGRPVLYGAFSCPWSYLASQRTDRIADDALRPVWRLVDPQAPPGTRLSAPAARPDRAGVLSAAQDLEAARELLLPGEHLPARPPCVLAHTGPAVVAYAEAVGAGVADQVRRVLFDAYWQEGADIGLPEVLRRLVQAPLRAGTSTVRPVRDHGYAISLTGGPITMDAWRRARAWHRDWLALAGLPAGSRSVAL